MSRTPTRTPTGSLLGLLTLLAACGGGSDPATPRTVADPLCESAGGRVERIELDSAGRPSEVGVVASALVWTPPCHDPDDVGATPTLYLLHGAGMRAATWEREPIELFGVLDELAATGSVGPMVVVVPDDSAVPSRFVDGVLAPLDDHLRRRAPTIARGSRAIGGFSAGGPNAARSAFLGDREYVAVGLFASIWSVALRDEFDDAQRQGASRVSVLVDIGEDDRLNNVQPQQLATLDDLRVQPEVWSSPGGHDLDFVGDRLADWIRWFDTALDVRPALRDG